MRLYGFTIAKTNIGFMQEVDLNTRVRATAGGAENGFAAKEKHKSFCVKTKRQFFVCLVSLLAMPLNDNVIDI